MTRLATISAGISHVGCKRKLNEDSYLVRPEAGMWAVCDGVGGHDAGEVASQAIVDALAAIDPPPSASALLAEVRGAITRVNGELRQQAGTHRTIASTAVVLLAFGEHFACLWAGDSRCYRKRGGQLQQISRDHSLVQDMVEKGLISAAEAENHPRGNVVTRAVGADDMLMLDKVNDRIQADDVFLLCSDGLSKVVPEQEMTFILNSYAIDFAVEKLVAAALEGGGPDNVTVVAVAFRDADAV
ncbi:PP2C family serine/threonine-protein phosphatase [Zavarzinia sp.]|uniref:PP2C family protein-serine/threonine phosphatase n=1 Tax=Zavarzinia sp. TaxID=2027920 RepID=UPI00356732C5